MGQRAAGGGGAGTGMQTARPHRRRGEDVQRCSRTGAGGLPPQGRGRRGGWSRAGGGERGKGNRPAFRGSGGRGGTQGPGVSYSRPAGRGRGNSGRRGPVRR